MSENLFWGTGTVPYGTVSKKMILYVQYGTVPYGHFKLTFIEILDNNHSMLDRKKFSKFSNLAKFMIH